MGCRKKYGYKPSPIAKGLRSKRTGHIGIIAEDIAHFSVPPIVEAVMNNLEQAGFQTILKNLRLYSRWGDSWFQDEGMVHSVADPAMDELRNMIVDGIIYIAVHSREVHIFPESFDIPVVMVYALEQNPIVPSIVPDDEDAGYQAYQYLIQKGHNRIGIISGKADNLHAILRMQGVRRAMEENGFPYEEALVRYGDWQIRQAYEVMAELVDAGVTAVFCMSDMMAVGAYQQIYTMGKYVGRDISVMGFDNIVFTDFFTPSLSTMELPLIEIGDRAAACILDRIQGNEGRRSGNFGTPFSLPKSNQKPVSKKYLFYILIDNKILLVIHDLWYNMNT